MSQPSSGRSSRTPPPAGSTATRGVILVVAAVVVGLLLLWKGGGGAATPGEETAGKPDGKPAATTTVTEAPTQPTAVPPAELKILAANGSSVKGLAAKTKEQLAAAGYPAVTAADATQQVTTTIVYFAEGFEADAKAVAASLGLAPARVTAMPQSPPVAALGDNKIVVVLGPDAPAANPATTAAPTTVAP